jgi:GntR family transcriptional regulator, transcriptional repressor for pyruvate dehydrogenase complex
MGRSRTVPRPSSSLTLDAGEGLFQHIRLKSPSDQIAEQVRSLVAKGRLRPGQQLPTERQMAVMLGVGRQAVRGALSKLARSGLVEVVPFKGAFIRSLTPDSLRGPLLTLLDSEIANMFEFMEVRKVIEAWCAEEAARRADPVKLKRVEESLTLMDEAIRAGRSIARADIEFHTAIADAAENVILVHLMDTFTSLLHSTARFRNIAADASNVGTYLAEHRAIYEAIERGDGAEARRRMLGHLATVTARVRAVLREAKVDAVEPAPARRAARRSPPTAGRKRSRA